MTETKHHKTVKPWQVPLWRPNVQFGGWVLAKGGNAGSRLAWASQEVLDTMDDHKYKFVKEGGLYEGQKGTQWRNFTFKVPHSKFPAEVYLKESGKKVWMRVGPSEPPAPAAYTLAEVEQMKANNLKVLEILRKKFDGRLKPQTHVVSSWQAAFDYQTDTADQ